jgi:hypothetical protein
MFSNLIKTVDFLTISTIYKDDKVQAILVLQIYQKSIFEKCL